MTILSNYKASYIVKAILFCAVFTGLFFVLSSSLNIAPKGFERLMQGVIGTLAALIASFLFLRFDKKKFSDINLVFKRSTLGNFLSGVVIGVLIMGTMASGVLYFTKAEIALNPNSTVWHFLVVTLPLIPLALMEELGFRAYPLEILKEKTGIRASIGLTSILFALYHVASGWSVASSFYGPAVWGLLFGLAAVYSNGIALPTGIHYGANLTTSAFGEANNSVSIWTVQHVVVTTPKGVDWMTLLPMFGLLTFGIFCIEIYMKQMKPAKSSLVKIELDE